MSDIVVEMTQNPKMHQIYTNEEGFLFFRKITQKSDVAKSPDEDRSAQKARSYFFDGTFCRTCS